jgi:hypothetical protein
LSWILSLLEGILKFIKALTPNSKAFNMKNKIKNPISKELAVHCTLHP